MKHLVNRVILNTDYFKKRKSSTMEYSSILSKIARTVMHLIVITAIYQVGTLSRIQI